MSKRKKRKFKSNYQAPALSQSEPQHSAPATVSHVSAQAQPTRQDPNTAVYKAHDHEYKQIQGDLVKVIIVNGALFALVIVLYFINKSNHFVDNLFHQIF